MPAGMYLYDGICGIVLLLGEYLKYFQDEKAKDVFNLAVRRMCIYTQELEMGQVNSSIRTGVFDGECSVVYLSLIHIYSSFLCYSVAINRQKMKRIHDM